jgi:hypothetical protein
MTVRQPFDPAQRKPRYSKEEFNLPNVATKSMRLRFALKLKQAIMAKLWRLHERLLLNTDFSTTPSNENYDCSEAPELNLSQTEAKSQPVCLVHFRSEAIQP